jgi:hypothetical protein
MEGKQIVNAQCKMTINDLPAYWVETRRVSEGLDLRQLHYSIQDGGHAWGLTFSVESKDASKYKAIFEEIAQTFQVE